MTTTAPAPLSAFPDMAIFRGNVYHRRHHPHPYHFRQPLLMLFINTDKIAALKKILGILAPLGIINWRRQDYLPQPNTSLTDSVLATLKRTSGVDATGPVYLLAQPRQFGSAYNPATFYFIGNGNNTRAAHLLVEVHNTPWGERFYYSGQYPTNTHHRNPATARMEKTHRVSPFNPLNMSYQWRYNQPYQKFYIHMNCYHQQSCHFDATLLLKRQSLTRRHLIAAIGQRPFSAAAAKCAIYRHAFQLWCKKTPLYADQFSR